LVTASLALNLRALFKSGPVISIRQAYFGRMRHGSNGSGEGNLRGKDPHWVPCRAEVSRRAP
jgi:hypothetical protein